MAVPTAQKTDEALERTTRILEGLFDRDATHKLNVRLWDGSTWPDGASRPATLVLKHPGALRAMFMPGTEVALGEAYIYDDFDIEGDVEQVFDFAYRLDRDAPHLGEKLHLGLELMGLPSHAVDGHRSSRRGPARLHGQPHSIERDRQAVTYH